MTHPSRGSSELTAYRWLPSCSSVLRLLVIDNKSVSIILLIDNNYNHLIWVFISFSGYQYMLSHPFTCCSIAVNISQWIVYDAGLCSRPDYGSLAPMSEHEP